MANSKYTYVNGMHVLFSSRNVRQRYCVGWKVILKDGLPLEGHIFSSESGSVFTEPCPHGNECEQGQEVLYFLLKLIAKGHVKDTMKYWKILFPERGSKNVKFSPEIIPGCSGFKLATIDGGTRSVFKVPVKEYHFNMHGIPFTEMCNHVKCNMLEKYSYALIRLYSAGYIPNILGDGSGQPTFSPHVNQWNPPPSSRSTTSDYNTVTHSSPLTLQLSQQSTCFPSQITHQPSPMPTQNTQHSSPMHTQNTQHSPPMPTQNTQHSSPLPSSNSHQVSSVPVPHGNQAADHFDKTTNATDKKDRLLVRVDADLRGKKMIYIYRNLASWAEKEKLFKSTCDGCKLANNKLNTVSIRPEHDTVTLRRDVVKLYRAFGFEMEPIREILMDACFKNET